MKRLFRGFWSAFQGLDYLRRHRELWWLAALPALVNAVLFLAAGGVFVHYVPRMLHAATAVTNAWLQWFLYVMFALALVLGVALAVIFLFTAVGAVIAAPFLDALSERVEINEGRAVPSTTVRRFLAGLRRSAATAAAILGLFVGVEVMLLGLLLIPAIGHVAYAAAAPLVGSFFLAAGFFDLSLARRGLRPAERINYLWRRKFEATGFGLAIFLTTFAPLLNFLLLPAAAVGATLLFLRIEEEEHDPAVSR